MDDEQGVMKITPCFTLPKKPRRVRTRRCEKNEICFLRRHVRRKKHFSAHKCASCPLKADNECAKWAAALLEKVALPLFRQSQARRDENHALLFCAFWPSKEKMFLPWRRFSPPTSAAPETAALETSAMEVCRNLPGENRRKLQRVELPAELPARFGKE